MTKLKIRSIASSSGVILQRHSQTLSQRPTRYGKIVIWINSYIAIAMHGLALAEGGGAEGLRADTRLIQDYLGHQNIQHTVRYTTLSPNRFKNFY